MLSRPRFRPHLHVEVVPGEGVFVLSGSRQALLRGRLYELIAPCLNGATVDDICDELRQNASSAEILYTLGQLELKKYICEGQQVLSEGEAALWSSLQIAPEEAIRRLEQRPVNLVALGVDLEPFRELLGSMHVRLTDAGDPDVVVTDSYEREELKEINAQALRTGKSWLIARPLGRQLWFGPLFEPAVTGCWACLVHRLQANSPVSSYLQQQGRRAGAVDRDRSRSPATLQVGWGLLANAVASWIVRGESPELTGKVQTFELPTWQLQSHTVVRLPFCPACGHAGQPRSFQEPAFHPRRKTYTSDGGHRVISPEQTLQKYGYHVSSITGAVPMLERVKSDDDVMHVYLAGNNMARPHHNLAQLRSDLRTMSSGKGITDIQAKASGLCEGLERYSGVYRGDEPRQRARMRDLGNAAISLESCLLFSDHQYRSREAQNAAGSRFSFIPAPFNPEIETDWSPVWSMSRQEVRYLPTAFCYFDYPSPRDHVFCIGCSNGNAAGNTLEEAILQGFLELVERDSVALWWYNRIQRPGVDLQSFKEPYLERLQQHLNQRGREFWVVDLTSDLAIPVFASISRRLNRPDEQIILGFGAHLDPKLALLRAVTEMNQMLSSPLLDDKTPEVGDPSTDPETAVWLKTATVANQPYLLPGPQPRTQLTTYSYQWADDVIDDVRHCQQRVEQAGLEMLVLDQTRPEIGLPVAKVIVPGLRHFWARFAPGRLYDVPVSQGWLNTPLNEFDLNPIPMFL